MQRHDDAGVSKKEKERGRCLFTRVLDYMADLSGIQIRPITNDGRHQRSPCFPCQSLSKPQTSHSLRHGTRSGSIKPSVYLVIDQVNPTLAACNAYIRKSRHESLKSMPHRILPNPQSCKYGSRVCPLAYWDGSQRLPPPRLPWARVST